MTTATKYIIASLVLATAVFSLSSLVRHHDTPIKPAVQRSIDSLFFTAPSFHARLDTLTHRETVFVRQSATHQHVADLAASSANAIHHQVLAAESLAVHDTSSAWKQVATLLGVENDSLRSANRNLDSALAEQTAARVAADEHAAADTMRRAALERLNARLVDDLHHTDPPCRVLWVVKCPSRKASFIAGVLTPIAAVVVVKATKRPIHTASVTVPRKEPGPRIE